jgi:RNA polymerase sigma-70 factor (ECF subfamily)
VTNFDPEKAIEDKADIERLLIASKKLTAAQQEVITLRFAGELPIAEVARIMGKTQGAIKALQHSAIAALRKLMTVEENV